MDILHIQFTIENMGVERIYIMRAGYSDVRVKYTACRNLVVSSELLQDSKLLDIIIPIS